MNINMDLRCPAAALVLAAAVFAGAGCRAKTEVLPSAGGSQTGIASWYGEEFHGRPTSSREIYDMNDLTAAHRTLPLGTQAAVTNLNNGRSVIVRINDRGPFAKNRVIDLSYAAAKVIGLIGPGTAPVRIEVLKTLPPPPWERGVSVQVGAFVSRANAEALKDSLDRRFAGVQVVPFQTAERTYYRVRVRCASRPEAEDLAHRLSEAGHSSIICEEW